MPFGQSLLSLAASGLYGCVLVVCLAAAITARGSRQLPGHVWTWLLLALFFAALIPLRLLEVEEAVRDSLRAAMRAEFDAIWTLTASMPSSSAAALT